MPVAADKITEAQRGFDAALRRMAAATEVEDLYIETTNALGFHYKLSEARIDEVGKRSFHQEIQQVDLLQAVRWTRNADVHAFTQVSTFADSYSDTYTEMFGTLVWQPQPALQAAHGEDLAYANMFAGKPVLDTLRASMTALVALCQS